MIKGIFTPSKCTFDKLINAFSTPWNALSMIKCHFIHSVTFSEKQEVDDVMGLSLLTSLNLLYYFQVI